MKDKHRYYDPLHTQQLIMSFHINSWRMQMTEIKKITDKNKIQKLLLKPVSHHKEQIE